ncbi:hypothetical protein GUITHDRAFT_113314 [Guillardia theta CCMP2712]|uniref:EF-hand domain-containing protein n=1 Tax=Guillardia theta (strain CCMP2712) TaxID=905079 RepID=L1IW87_GUITC|nr:hypothetical protein GUITHDRAFT_113314 [Guillardia theta CCMP2712]EKX40528.1 hypothetical protein GUITHDRAFT_113314 [Guillardia theta CCMP2712]|eukprot:XP_005827508.1 hypothetical protein GUITHDRAFT_113314 [Guillardia theta CCMP2712]
MADMANGGGGLEAGGDLAAASLIFVDVQDEDKVQPTVNVDHAERAEEKVPLDSLPPNLADALRRFNRSKDGMLNVEEIQEMALVFQSLEAGKIPLSLLPVKMQQTISASQDASEAAPLKQEMRTLDAEQITEAFDFHSRFVQIKTRGKIPLDVFPPSAHQQLKMMDINNDEFLDSHEILTGISALKNERNKSRMYFNFLIILGILFILTQAAVFGLTYAVIEITKDSEVKAGGVMTVKGTDEPVRVASTDFDVKDGVLTSRRSLNMTCSNDTCAVKPIQTAQSTSPAKLTSLMDDEQLSELRSMKVIQGQAFIHFQIFAVARYEETWSRHGSVVVIYTHLGDITLDGEVIVFHESLQGAFTRAGFQVDSHGRRLLGVVEILGMFNIIRSALKQESAEHSKPDQLPAFPPSQYTAHVVEVEFCEDEGGKSTYSCQTGGGETVDWVTDEDAGRKGLRLEEDQYSLTFNSRHWAKTVQTKAQWPEQKLIKIQNESHKLTYQVFKGKYFFCDLREDQSLASVVDNRRALASPKASSDFEILFQGFQSVNGIYCKHFEIRAKAEGSSEVFHVYEDYYRKRLYQFVRGNLRWRFDSLMAIEGEENNPIPLSDLDMETILQACDPQDLIPPAKLMEGSVSNIIVPDPSWGLHENASTTMEDMSSFEPGANMSRRLLFSDRKKDVNDQSWSFLGEAQLLSRAAESTNSQPGNSSLRSFCSRLGYPSVVQGPYSSISSAKSSSKTTARSGSIGLEFMYESCKDNVAMYIKPQINYGCPSFSGGIELEIRGLNSNRATISYAGDLFVSINPCRCPPMRLPSAISSFCPSLGVGIGIVGGLTMKEYYTCSVGQFGSNPLITGYSTLSIGPYWANARFTVSGYAYLGFRCGSMQRSGQKMKIGHRYDMEARLDLLWTSKTWTMPIYPTEQNYCSSQSNPVSLRREYIFKEYGRYAYAMFDSDYWTCK